MNFKYLFIPVFLLLVVGLIFKNVFLYILFVQSGFFIIFYFLTVKLYIPVIENIFGFERKHRSKYLLLILFIFLFLWPWVHEKLWPLTILRICFIAGFLLTLLLNLYKASLKKLILTSVLFVFAVLITSVAIKNGSYKYDYSALKSLPYFSIVSSGKQDDNDGVVINKTDKLQDEMFLYNSFQTPSARIINTAGEIVHEWNNESIGKDWEYVTLNRNNELLSSVTDKKLVCLDLQSCVIWERNMRSHHDIAVTLKNDIFALNRRDALVFYHGIPLPLLDDTIVKLDNNGEIIKEFSLFPYFRDAIEWSQIGRIYYWILNPNTVLRMIKCLKTNGFSLEKDTPFDIMHNNCISFITDSTDQFDPATCLLISARELDLISIIDFQSQKTLWSFGPRILSEQHHPTMLENGNILVFDNGRKYSNSRVLEINPQTKEIVWSYEGDPPSSFYSSRMGSAKRLKNGNTLITDSNSGRVIQVTRDGGVAWEWFNPERDEKGNKKTLYRMMNVTGFRTNF